MRCLPVNCLSWGSILAAHSAVYTQVLVRKLLNEHSREMQNKDCQISASVLLLLYCVNII